MGRQLHRLQFHLDCTVQSDSLGPRSVVLRQSIFRASCAASAAAMTLLAAGRADSAKQLQQYIEPFRMSGVA